MSEVTREEFEHQEKLADILSRRCDNLQEQLNILSKLYHVQSNMIETLGNIIKRNMSEKEMQIANIDKMLSALDKASASIAQTLGESPMKIIK